MISQRSASSWVKLRESRGTRGCDTKPDPASAALRGTSDQPSEVKAEAGLCGLWAWECGPSDQVATCIQVSLRGFLPNLLRNWVRHPTPRRCSAEGLGAGSERVEDAEGWVSEHVGAAESWVSWRRGQFLVRVCQWTIRQWRFWPAFGLVTHPGFLITLWCPQTTPTQNPFCKVHTRCLRGLLWVAIRGRQDSWLESRQNPAPQTWPLNSVALSLEWLQPPGDTWRYLSTFFECYTRVGRGLLASCG